MKLPFLPRFSSPKTLFQYPLALVGGLLLSLVPTAAQAQSVTFAGAQTTLPFSSRLLFPAGVAVDSVGDVFVTHQTDVGHGGLVVELPRTATGYGPQNTLPTSGLMGSIGVAVDSAGNVFLAD